MFSTSLANLTCNFHKDTCIITAPLCLDVAKPKTAVLFHCNIVLLLFFLKVLAASLQDLLDYEGDVENEMMCTFTIGYTDMFGSSITKELKENGSQMVVNNENRWVNLLFLFSC